jgi:AcrR family transcriptional regulator
VHLEARVRFAEHGYGGATIRRIAADAGVDPALVHHNYETKEGCSLLRAFRRPSKVLQRVISTGKTRLGEEIVRTLFAIWGWAAHRRESQ